MNTFRGRRILLHDSIKTILIRLLRLFANRPLFYSICCVSTLSAKLIHIYAHLDVFPNYEVVVWGPSFFLQDTIVLLLVRILLDLGIIPTLLGVALSLLSLSLASASISFFLVAGTELQWRNVDVASSPSAWGMLLAGLVSLLTTLGFLLAASLFLQGLCFTLANASLDLLRWPVLSCFPARCPISPQKSELDYSPLPQADSDYSSDSDTESQADTLYRSRSTSVIIYRILSGLAIFAQITCTIFRPSDNSMIFLSWTLLLVPLIHAIHGATLAITVAIPAAFEGVSSLATPAIPSWLPNRAHAGFDDWYLNASHYSPEADPIRTSNLHEDLLPLFDQGALRNVTIRHVVLIKLESTRKDVFPLKRDSLIWDRLASTFSGHGMPVEVQKRYDSISKTARYLTGEFDGAYTIDNRSREQRDHGRLFRGGISATNAKTTATYTLKSLVGTHCGASPLAADFDVEHNHPIYQPCLPHILDIFNDLECEGSHSQWMSRFLQSTTLGYDKQDLLMPKLGFQEDNIIGQDYLRGKGHKFPPANISDINYFGMPEIALQDYLRDTFRTAKKDDKRVFLSHLTSTTHHEFGLPKGEEHLELTGSGTNEWNMLADYLNAIGYVDKWLGKILDTLEEEGVADETLLVVVGDHGLPIAEHNSPSPYHDSNIGSSRVPLVFSHHQLPSLQLSDPVTSLQILPTILDLLRESGSLSECQSRAAGDLLHNYEGQSLLRPRHPDWQFTIMNPGGAGIAVQDARSPHLRLIVPLQAGQEWRFSDLGLDPYEMSPLSSFDFGSLTRRMRFSRYKDHIAWVKEATGVAKWWVTENHRRWRYQA